MIPLNRPVISNNRSKLSLETFFKEQYPDRYCQTTFSTRQALSMVYHSLFEEKGSLKVAVSPLTCFEALYPIVGNGHNIVFVDVNPHTFNMDETKIPKQVDVIQAIHFGGNPQDMGTLVELASSKGVLLIEDCAQALGAKYQGEKVGLLGDYSAFSFIKNTFALGGGFLLSKNLFEHEELNPIGHLPVLYRRLKRTLESKSKIKSPVIDKLLLKLVQLKPEKTNDVFTLNSINRTIKNSIQSQLSIFDFLINERKNNAKYILANLKNPSILPQKSLANSECVYSRLLFRSMKLTTKQIIEKLRLRGIGANHLSQNTIKTFQESVFETNAFKQYGIKENLQNYLNLHDYIFSIPISPSLKKMELNYIVDALNEI